jgi:predicted transcriptional regulator
MDLLSLVEEIKKDKKAREITPRELFNGLSCYRRTPGNCNYVDQFLNKHNLEVEPGYNDVWIDSTIKIRHKPLAKTKSPKDPIKKVQILKAASQLPKFIDNSANIEEAITTMQLYNYSQLPVTNNGLRGLCGYISWETIGIAIFNGIKSKIVKDYKSDDIEILNLQTPLLKAIRTIYEHDFAVVIKEDQSLCGIITTTDISSQFLSITEPFVLLEEIENQIRNLFDEHFLLEEIKTVCLDSNKKIETIDDMTFGEYIKIMEIPENWDKLEIESDRRLFIQRLDEIRQIRNDIMHFEPAGITEEQYQKLQLTSRYLDKITKYRRYKTYSDKI